MRLTGPGIFGPPADRAEAVLLLREAIDRGVNHIDTAFFYGPGYANELIREALHPYPLHLILVSKVGAARDGSGGVIAFDEPAQLRRGIEDNLRSLGVERLPIVNLRMMRDGQTDALFDDQVATMIGGPGRGADRSGRSEQRQPAAAGPCDGGHRHRLRAEHVPLHGPPLAACP